MTSKKTVVVGASSNKSRYSYIATERLLEYGHDVLPIGLYDVKIHGLQIMPYGTPLEHVHTITLYLSPQHQPQYYSYLLNMKPERIIFNPGTENEEFAQLAYDANIRVEEACTLVLLSTGQF